MNTYIFLRHSEPDVDEDFSPSEWELSGKGQQLVDDLLNYGFSYNLNHIYSSTEIKAIQTAEPFADKFNLQIVKSENLKEVQDGEFLPYDEWLEFKRKSFYDIHFSQNNGESLIQALSRITSLIKDLDENYDNCNILIVSHGTILTTYFASIMGILGKGKEIYEKWESINFCQLGILYNNKIVKHFLNKA